MDIIHSNPYWDVRQEPYTATNGVHSTYYWVHTPGSVMVVPMQDDGRIVMVRQFRYLNRQDSLEFPGGGVKPGMDPEEAARAELGEEAGLASADLVRLGQFNPCNGLTDEICTVYLARTLVPTTARPDPTEDLEILVLHPHEITDAIRQGRLWDGMSIAAWMLTLTSQHG
jgi:ADP-ribose pyrophosphatase